MSRRTWVRAVLASALVPPLLVVVSANPSFAAPVQKSNLKLVESLKPTKQVKAAKAQTSRLAKTDPTLLNRTDSNQVSIAVKLDYDSIATYTGEIAGYAATSPTVTGKDLSGSSAEKRYEGRIKTQEDTFLAALKKSVPNAKVGQRLRTVYGGVALTVPANKIGQILSIPGVVAVQGDVARQPQTDSSTKFIGANAIYPQLGGEPNAGKGVIYGVLDSGAWPEHPSFADNGNLAPAPAKADGTPRACDFGDNPLTPASDVFVCNKKLIGGKGFLDTYNAVNEVELYGYTARDSDGHGTHTASTAAGNPVASAPVLGVERGPINGVAPGAWVSVYKVCGEVGCYQSDSAAAVAQAILDGVKVINFSISGGESPFTDVVELAFLDAYAAGVFVSASAGNAGPTASSAGHLSPWVTTVAASKQTRTFESTLTVSSGDGTSATFTGNTITQGVGPLPVVMASAAPYGNATCTTPAPAGIFVGKIVACERSAGRILKGFNVLQGGAAGMILYNATLQDGLTDNHWLPTVHLPNGQSFLAYVNAHPGITAKFTAGAKATGVGDVMANFSSKGPGFNFIKPDITAPGVQILAGNTPTLDTVEGGPQGQYYMAIAGTSMSSPHIAGSALLMRALHPDWTPGQVKSALMTTATTKVLKEDGVTPADPFDFGAGRVQLQVSGNPGLTFDETAERMASLGNDLITSTHINLPSVNAPVMPGKLTTVRTAKNVTDKAQTYRVETTAPAGSSITVSPAVFTVQPGASVALNITIRSSAPEAQLFGEVRLLPLRSGLPKLHLPVAFIPKQGDVKVTQSCDPSTVNLLGTTVCTVTATNGTFNDTTADFVTTPALNLPAVAASGATVVNPFKVEKKGAPLAGAVPGTPSIAPGTVAGYIPLDAFGGTLVNPVGDEELVTFNVPTFTYNGVQHAKITVDSNGYLYPGGDTSNENNNCCNISPIPNPAKPNNVLAPFWTDLDGTGAPGLLVNVLTDGVNSWIVVEWRVNDFGTTKTRVFQVWMGTGTTQDIAFAYDLPSLAAPVVGQDFVVGAENLNGTGGQGLPVNTKPTEDLRVTSSEPVPGASVSYTVTLRGLFPGPGKVTTSVTSPAAPGTTVVSTNVTVTGRFNRIGT